MNKIILSLIFFVATLGYALPQHLPMKHKATFYNIEPGYYENVILKEINKKQNINSPKKYLTVDFSGFDYPSDTALYTKYWHYKPVSQGNTGTCWAFASVAFLESEVYRITKNKIKLSEMYIVYCDYVERTKHFVQTRGETYFEEGSEANATPRMMAMYGILPFAAYSGLLPEQKVHNHSKMIEEMKDYLSYVKQSDFWNEEEVLKNIKSILNSYMGEPPQKFVYEGKTYTPKTFMEDYLKINPVDYFSFMSTMSEKYNQKAELVEPDNWWHSKDYYNVSLDDFFLIITDALENGYTVCVCGDVSEAGNDSKYKISMIPTFDIPSEYIDENARQHRLSNNSTTDDHCMQIVGYTKYNKKYWFLVKDSGASAFNAKPEGYRFINEDYIKLKMMNILVYKYAAHKVLDKIIK